MTRATLRSWLKVSDPTAFTALDALQRALGYGRRLRGLTRSEIWSFRFSEPVDAHAVIDRLARETNLLVNPNKHAYEISTAQTLQPKGNAWILASQPGAGGDLSDTLDRHALVRPAPEVRRGVLWELDISDAQDAEAMAQEIAVARTRTQGLLTNPHMEDATVFMSPPTGEMVADTFGW